LLVLLKGRKTLKFIYKIKGAKGFDRVIEAKGCTLRLSGGLIKNLAKT